MPDLGAFIVGQSQTSWFELTKYPCIVMCIPFFPLFTLLRCVVLVVVGLVGCSECYIKLHLSCRAGCMRVIWRQLETDLVPGRVATGYIHVICASYHVYIFVLSILYCCQCVQQANCAFSGRLIIKESVMSCVASVMSCFCHVMLFVWGCGLVL